MAEVTGMTPEKITQEINNVKSYVDGGLSEKADTSQVTSDLSKKADVTKVALDLSKKADISYVESLLPLKSFMGSGFPEGKVSAPVGTIYTDSEATNGAIRWIKTIGTDDTGWQVEYGDTGWRDLSSSLYRGWTADLFIMRRVGAIVEVRATNLNGANSKESYFLTQPKGFRAGRGSLKILATTNDTSMTAERVNIVVSGNNGHLWMTSRNVTTAALSASYLTDDRWPSTLPGTPFNPYGSSE